MVRKPLSGKREADRAESQGHISLAQHVSFHLNVPECPHMKGDRTHVSTLFFPDEEENGLFMPYVGLCMLHL